MTPITLNRWTGSSNSLRIRVARELDRAGTSGRIEAVLRAHGAPIAYEVFDRDFVLCEPHLPGVQGDPDIALVIGDAEHELFFVAQRERGGLKFLSVHEAIHDAVRDFLGRAMGAESHMHISGVIATRDQP
ncbi:MAG: hypothetical protein J0L51_02865 [Rhizobiales bacterium]|nr:hypothetical protein [Hyphomicrobiales bacterium]